MTKRLNSFCHLYSYYINLLLLIFFIKITKSYTNIIIVIINQYSDSKVSIKRNFILADLNKQERSFSIDLKDTNNIS